MAEWEEVTDPAEARKIMGTDAYNQMTGTRKGGGGKFSPQAQKFLNELSQQSQEAGETQRLYDETGKYIRTLKPGPYRGAFLDMAIPQENGGFLDKLGAFAIGGPARLTGAITPEEISAYQGLKRIQSEQVLGKQLLQKGPQTESDAARLQLTEVSPQKNRELNDEIVRAGKSKTDRIKAKSVFYTAWANKYGLNGLSPEGFTADQVWAREAEGITARVLGRSESVNAFNQKRKNRPTGKFKILSREKVR